MDEEGNAGEVGRRVLTPLLARESESNDTVSSSGTSSITEGKVRRRAGVPIHCLDSGESADPRRACADTRLEVTCVSVDGAVA